MVNEKTRTRRKWMDAVHSMSLIFPRESNAMGSASHTRHMSSCSHGSAPPGSGPLNKFRSLVRLHCSMATFTWIPKIPWLSPTGVFCKLIHQMQESFVLNNGCLQEPRSTLYVNCISL